MSKLQLRFYSTAAGNEPVREWIKKLPKEARQEIGGDLRDVQENWNPGMPLVDGFGKGLWEVRSTSGKVEYGILVGIVDEQIVLLHGFVKKTKATSKADKDLGYERLAEVKKAAKKQ